MYRQPHTALSLSVGLIRYRASGTQCAPINLNQTCRRHVISLTPYGVPYGVSITHDCLACRRHATTKTISFISHQRKRVSQHRKPISHQCGGHCKDRNYFFVFCRRVSTPCLMPASNCTIAQKSDTIKNSPRPIEKKSAFFSLMLTMARTKRLIPASTIIIVAYVYHLLRST